MKFTFNNSYYSEYQSNVIDLKDNVEKFDFSNKEIDFSHRIIASAVYSTNIEGNSLDLNSFMNWKSIIKKNPTKEHREIEDLIEAYGMAFNEKLTERSFLEVHKIASKEILIKSKRGKYRQEQVGVFGESGLLYLAIEPELVKEEMKRFFGNIFQLLLQKLNIEEVFYYASFIHLRFAHIHPFADGNGRMARILEKWFIVEKLGQDFWRIPSEKYYKEQRKEYYTNINLGINFYALDYSKSMPFLLMLPICLKN